MYKVYCVAPFILKDSGKDYESLHLEFEELIKNDDKYVLMNLSTKQQDHNRYQTMSKNATLTQDNFFKVVLKNDNDKTEDIRIIGHQNQDEKKNIYLVYYKMKIANITFTEEGLDKLQCDCNQTANDIMEVILDDMNIPINYARNYLWVNRTLELSLSDIKEHEETLKSYWCYIQDDLYSEINNKGYHVAWGNNIFSKETVTNKKENLIDSILIMQYYSAIIDETNENLKALIETISISQKNQDKALPNFDGHDNIKSYISYHEKKTKQVIIDYNDDLLNLQGFRQYYALELANKWNIDKVINNIREKISYCEETIESIELTKRMKSLFVTDMLLFLVGLSSALSFALSLGQSLDTITVNPGTNFNERIINLFIALYNFPKETLAGLMSSITSLLMVILLFIYVVYRRRNY